jgi:hypothetical protein
MNSYIDKLFKKRKRVDYFITVGIIVRRNDERGMMVAGGASMAWCSGYGGDKM